MGHNDLLLLIHVLKVQNALAIWGNVLTPLSCQESNEKINNTLYIKYGARAMETC